MRVRTHLISMPWAQPDFPSIQIASLKGHLDRVLQSHDDCLTHSAFFAILHEFKGRTFQEFFRSVEAYGEYIYMLLYLRRFGPSQFRNRTTIARLLKSLRTPEAKPLSLHLLSGLERATCRFLNSQVAPKLLAKGLNLIGFTLNFHQVYASLYAAEHLRHRFEDRQFFFVYGGCAASLPSVYNLLVDLGVPGVVVIGEGEKKLECLVRALAGHPSAEPELALSVVAGLDPGIIVIGEKVDLTSCDPAYHSSQLTALNDLALPDYDEYFATLRRACADEKVYAAFRAETPVLVEGSRGCFGKCDFCALSRTWRGYRRRSGEQVARDTLALTRKYHTARVMFVDNVCSTWAGDYARTLVQAGIRQKSFMELRANYPEQFWTLLALAGVQSVQVGVEALSSPLLKAIGKGTTVLQNLAVQKYLAELGMWPNNHLITHHPASTLSDIRETRRILDLVSHWGPFRPTQFELMAGSPFYRGLSQTQRLALKPLRSFRLQRQAARYALDSSFEVPACLAPDARVRRAWSALDRHCARRLAKHQAKWPRLEVVRLGPETLRITDTRNGKIRVDEFHAAAARVYDACHCGLKLGEICQATDLSPKVVKGALAKFLQLKLMLQVDDHYISLAMRPRDELLSRFFVKPSTLS